LFSYLALVGRILYGGFFIMSGIHHFTAFGMLSGYAASKGLPAAPFFIALAGLMILAGGLSILLGYKPRWGALLIVLFLIPVSFTMHNYWAETGPQAQMDNVNFMKNMALAGAAVMLMAIPRWPLSLERAA
jgi:uncharacterized membrane protein YphA (DoxX/SURF4 family)